MTENEYVSLKLKLKNGKRNTLLQWENNKKQKLWNNNY